jgi:hypothetical protein
VKEDSNQIKFFVLGFPVSGNAGRTLAAMPKSTSQTSRDLRRAYKSSTVQQHRAFVAV